MCTGRKVGGRLLCSPLGLACDGPRKACCGMTTRGRTAGTGWLVAAPASFLVSYIQRLAQIADADELMVQAQAADDEVHATMERFVQRLGGEYLRGVSFFRRGRGDAHLVEN